MILTVTVTELVLKLIQANEKKITKVGGASAWDALSAEEKAAQHAETHHDFCIQLGEEALLACHKQSSARWISWYGQAVACIKK